MYWKISDTARIFKVSGDLVKDWAFEFIDYLSPSANPPKNQERKFSVSDIQVLAYVFEHWEDEPDLENIKIGLNLEYHKDDRYPEVPHFSSPLFQEIPEDLDENRTEGIILSDVKVNQPVEIARAYRYAADTLLQEALRYEQGHALDYPIFFAYRHCIELYLKLIGEISEDTHSISRCLRLVEYKYGIEIKGMVKSWLEEFDQIDKKGTTFRYSGGDSLQSKEYWIDLKQLSIVMGKLCEIFEGVYWDNMKKPLVKP